MKGFFSSTPTLRQTLPLVAQCHLCKLDKECLSPKMGVNGKGERKILIVGEAPGENEDKRNLPFIGKTGKLLSETLAKFDVKMRRDCWIINSARCRPPKNALPEKSIDFCRPNVINDIKELNPEVIILLGGAAVKSVLGWLFKPEPGGITKWAGWRIPCQKINTWICPAWHPSYVSRGEKNEQVIKLLWEKHLEEAVNLSGRPWKKVPDWESQARIEMDVRKVPGWIDRLMESGKPLAWDIETDRLNPDHPDARIVCCSVSDGNVSVSYPWHGEAIEATKRFIVSNVPKFGFSIKYETKWARKLLKVTPRNWKWCGQLAAHVLDNRPGICSLEFQEFAVLGFPEHKSKIKPYLEGDGSNDKNRIDELSLERQLLKYNSLDSLIEWKLADKQMQQMGVQL